LSLDALDERAASLIEDVVEPGRLLADILSGFGNDLFARYGHPAYLVGSGLETRTIDDIWKLRDVDIVCVLPDDEFFNRFGADWLHVKGGLSTAIRWVTEVGKMARQAARCMSNLNVDFKVQSESWAKARHDGKPRLRIDRAGE
jgi:hypothetical protein